MVKKGNQYIFRSTKLLTFLQLELSISESKKVEVKCVPRLESIDLLVRHFVF